MIREKDIDAAEAAAKLVVTTHQRLAEWLTTGLTLAEIDQFVARTLADLNTRSAFLRYSPARYPAFPSHACLSLNDVVVHGTAGMSLKPMAPGDVLSIDIGVVYRGWIGDAAWTYVFKEASDEAKRLCECGMNSLRLGIQQLQPGRPLVNWAEAVQTHVEQECGFHCVRGLGGHGYGRKLHQPPYVANTVPTYPGEWPEAKVKIKPGLLIAVEPMVAVGTSKLAQQSREWPIRTADGSLSVHYEHDVLVTEDGPRVFTQDLEDLPMIVG